MKESTFGRLIDALLDGDHALAAAAVREITAGGVGPEMVVTAGIEKAMSRLDEKCTVGHFNLLEMMLAGRAVGVCVETEASGLLPA